MKKDLAMIPIRAERRRKWTWHPQIWWPVGPDTKTSKEASKLFPTLTTSPKRLILFEGKDYNTRKISKQT
jgi:hypothetical protein